MRNKYVLYAVVLGLGFNTYSGLYSNPAKASETVESESSPDETQLKRLKTELRTVIELNTSLTLKYRDELNETTSKMIWGHLPDPNRHGDLIESTARIHSLSQAIEFLEQQK